MMYMGGKAKIAKDIANIIHLIKGSRSVFLEPFIGGGSATEFIAPMFNKSLAGDVCLDLVLMWQAAISGWVPPVKVTEDEYRTAKASQPSALRGFIGFGCSFGGKWFGGYARDGHGRNYAKQASDAVTRKALAMYRTTVSHREYHDWVLYNPRNTVIYCDPPYAGVTGYKTKFDSAVFWQVAKAWHSLGAIVLVSEYSAPAGWVAVYEKQNRQHLDGAGKQKVNVERVFMWRGN